MAKSYDRSKEHFNIGTIGHVDHGKTTLTAAITRFLEYKYPELNKFVAFDKIDKAPEEKKRGITIMASHISYETPNRHFSHVDCPGHSDYVKNMITGADQMDGAILLVDANEGPLPQTREHIILAKQMGIGTIVVFLNKMDTVDDLEIVDLIEIEISEMLESYGFKSEDYHIVKGSAFNILNKETTSDEFRKWEVPMNELIEKITTIPKKNRPIDKNLRIYTDSVFSIPGRGTGIGGTVHQGKFKKNDEIRIIGHGKEVLSTVLEIQMHHMDLPEAIPGDNVCLLLRGVAREDISRGSMVVLKNDPISPVSKFKANLYISKPNEGGRKTPILNNFKPQFFLGTSSITGTIKLNEGEIIMPGDNKEVEIELLYPIVIEEGSNFSVREQNLTIAAGLVTKLL
jgi:elongation factor Tu